MGKKKNKKSTTAAQKQVEWASPSDSPKPGPAPVAEESVIAAPDPPSVTVDSINTQAAESAISTSETPKPTTSNVEVSAPEITIPETTKPAKSSPETTKSELVAPEALEPAIATPKILTPEILRTEVSDSTKSGTETSKAETKADTEATILENDSIIESIIDRTTSTSPEGMGTIPTKEQATLSPVPEIAQETDEKPRTPVEEWTTGDVDARDDYIEPSPIVASTSSSTFLTAPEDSLPDQLDDPALHLATEESTLPRNEPYNSDTVAVEDTATTSAPDTLQELPQPAVAVPLDTVSTEAAITPAELLENSDFPLASIVETADLEPSGVPEIVPQVVPDPAAVPTVESSQTVDTPDTQQTESSEAAQSRQAHPVDIPGITHPSTTTSDKAEPLVTEGTVPESTTDSIQDPTTTASASQVDLPASEQQTLTSGDQAQNTDSLNFDGIASEPSTKSQPAQVESVPTLSQDKAQLVLESEPGLTLVAPEQPLKNQSTSEEARTEVASETTFEDQSTPTQISDKEITSVPIVDKTVPPTILHSNTSPTTLSPTPSSASQALSTTKSLPAAPEPETAQPAPFREITRAPQSAPTPPPETVSKAAPGSTLPPTEFAHRVPTPATSERSSNTSFPVAAEPPKTTHGENNSRTVSAPRPEAIRNILEDNRPPAPSPPVGRARPRHISTFTDDDDDDSDSALLPPRRFRGGESILRDASRGSTYPPQPRSLFASRVPVESHTNPQPPPPPPPGYHPNYYPPAAPPYYQGHNYGMSQSSYPSTAPYGPSTHASSSPYQDSWNQYPPRYPPHGSPPQRQDSWGSRDYHHGVPPIENNTAIEHASSNVFSRIEQAIPDLHVLLARYKETHGQLSVREELLRRASAEQEEKLRVKDDEIGGLKERVRSLESKHSSEANRLRLEIGNLEEQIKELREQVSETERYKKQAEETKIALDAGMRSWEAKFKELEDAHASLERTSAEEKASTLKDFDEWKSSTTTRHDAEKIALAIQFDKKLKEADDLAETRSQEAAAAFGKQKDDLLAEHERQQHDRDLTLERLREELEAKLSAAEKDREEALKKEQESRDSWLSEREALTKTHQEDRDSLQRGWDEQRDLLEAQHKKSKDESDKAWLELHADANRKAEEEKARAEQLSKERDELLAKCNELKSEGQKEKEIIRSIATNLESEKTRLEKLMECYGDIAEIKSKGDTYYLVSFSQLQKQIIDLATTHFVHLPVRPPAEELAQVPSTLPSFLGDTMASRQVRSAYVAHTVSKLITYRVFGPFLFSLGRRYDKADSLFLSMSNHIRDKSTRKEAIWRQQTLLAAFTSSGAKQRINTAAGTVVEEIVNAVKHFADPKEEEGIKIAVKRIVKLAAETWRFARLEREMITATMPALQDEEHQFTGIDYWPAYKPEGTMIPSLVGTAPPSDEQPQLLLRLFPVIYREPKHENFHLRGEAPDEGCIYHYGLALYDDAEPVVQRAEELKSAGLPSSPLASPLPAEFSGKFPPLWEVVPPPRDPLPPPPTTVEQIESRSISPLPLHESPTIAEKAEGQHLPLASISSPPEDLIEEKTSETIKAEPQPVQEPQGDDSSFQDSPSLVEVAHAGLPIPYTRPPPGPINFAIPHQVVEPPIMSETAPISRPISPTTKSIVDPVEADVGNSADSANQSADPAEAECDVSGNGSHISSSSPPADKVLDSPQATPADVAADALIEVAEDPSAAAPADNAAETPVEIPAAEDSADLPAQSSAVIPSSPIIPIMPLESSVRNMGSASGSAIPPTPPLSRSNTPPRPISPLFEATDEIDALQPYRSRHSGSTPVRRRSTHSRRSNDDELPEINPRSERPDTTRRISGYALSNRSSRVAESERTDKSDKPDRDPKSRYMCESRSAAIKGLYPNSPLAGQSASTSKNTISSSSKKKDRDSRDLKREDSFPSNGTWDTSSPSRTSEATNARISPSQ